MTRHWMRGAALAAALSVVSGASFGQAPTIDPLEPATPGGNGSLLGPPPGAGAGAFDNSPGAQQGTLGGRPGASTSRAPASISTPSGSTLGTSTRQGIVGPSVLPTADLPTYGSLTFPQITDDEGPADGLTLDAAIERLVRENLYLRAVSFEIPQAEADILTASLRANPVFYADSQLIPYGSYSRTRPGGQTQYDVNISYPLDLSRKRQARIVSASRARQVLEQQYRDAVRTQIDNLYTVYVDVLAARATVRFATVGVEGLEKLQQVVRSQYEQKAIRESEYIRVVLQRELAENNRRDATVQLGKARRSLANLLNIPPEQADGIDLRGPLQDRAPQPPGEDDLIGLAMESRPDLAAFRLGVARAEADVRLQLANRYQDVYVLYQPYTFQDNTPNGTKSASSWALGVTVPIPLYNRNQGNIQRARLNVGQTQTQLAGQMRQIINDVQQADREYRVTREAAERFDAILKPYAEQVLATAETRFRQGEENVIIFLAARTEYNAVVRQYVDVLVRHRRAMLDLNTAVGRRILP